MLSTTSASLRVGLLRHCKNWERQMPCSRTVLSALQLQKVSPALIRCPGIHRCVSFTPVKFSDDGKGLPIKQDDTVKKDAIEETESEYEAQYRPKFRNPLSKTFGVMIDDLRLFKNHFGDGIKKLKDLEKQKVPAEAVAECKAKDQTINENGPNSRTNTRPTSNETQSKSIWPAVCDVLVIGGGAVGSSIAYHLKERALDGLNVVVVEEDSSYKRASTVLSVGGIRQQFSIPENIHLSLYGMQFLRKAPELLAVEGADTPDMQFNPGGYLTLASESGVENLMENFRIQRDVGAKVEFLTSDRLKERFPWINTHGVEAGVVGLENEGWFDPWSLLCCLRRKAVNLGAEYVNGKVTGLNSRVLDDMVTEAIGNLSLQNIDTAEITLPNGEKREIKFSIVVVAAGAWSGEVGRLLNIGNGSGVMATPIPIEPRKRYVYCIHAPNGPGLDCPLVIDPNHAYFRREGLGNMYLCGKSPNADEEPQIDNLDVDESFFENQVWPTIANRVPAFENAKLLSSWAGFYDYNTFDQNGIIGLHPVFTNMFIAAGFSGHGIQQAPGVGRAMMECILHGEYKSINLERFGFDRVLVDEPLLERGIV